MQLPHNFQLPMGTLGKQVQVVVAPQREAGGTRHMRSCTEAVGRALLAFQPLQHLALVGVNDHLPPARCYAESSTAWPLRPKSECQLGVCPALMLGAS